MIEDYSRDLLRTGIINLKAGDRATARRYLDRALYMSGDHDVLAEAWFWMSQAVDDPAEQRKALENCLTQDLGHARARRALAVLDGKLKPEDIIDPDSMPVRGGSGSARSDLVLGESAGDPALDIAAQAVDAQRFTCPKCGGRMTYSPDGQSLVCDYCTSATSLRASASQRSGPAPLDAAQTAQPDQDFLLAMATARGHAKPLAEQVFHCQGCGARFILPPGQLSITCPYCLSAHVIILDRSPDLLAPDGILPHAFDQRRAAGLLNDWLHPVHSGSEIEPAPRALYLPLWTFDLGGALDYTGVVERDDPVGFERHPRRAETIRDSYPVMLTRLPIPASRKLSAPFIRLLPTFDLGAVRPYDPRFLADWPAELYDIPLAEASLDARSQALALLKRKMAAALAPVHILSTSSANLSVESFRLNLLPVWMAEVQAPPPTGDGAAHLLLINGHNGEIYGDLGSKPSQPGSLLGWLSDLIKE